METIFYSLEAGFHSTEIFIKVDRFQFGNIRNLKKDYVCPSVLKRGWRWKPPTTIDKFRNLMNLNFIPNLSAVLGVVVHLPPYGSPDSILVPVPDASSSADSDEDVVGKQTTSMIQVSNSFLHIFGKLWISTNRSLDCGYTL